MRHIVTPVMKTQHLFMETHYLLWKPRLQNKESSFVETIFEKQGMFEKKNSKLNPRSR
jgi:hypothetical protein